MIYYLPRVTAKSLGTLVGIVCLVLASACMASQYHELFIPVELLPSAQQRTADGRANYKYFLENIDKPEYRQSIHCVLTNYGPGEILPMPNESYTMLKFRDARSKPKLLVFPNNGEFFSGPDGQSTFARLVRKYKIDTLTCFW